MDTHDSGLIAKKEALWADVNRLEEEIDEAHRQNLPEANAALARLEASRAAQGGKLDPEAEELILLLNGYITS